VLKYFLDIVSTVTLMLNELALPRLEEIAEKIGVIFGSRYLAPVTA